MKNQTGESFFARRSQKFFAWRLDWEIFKRIFSHLRGDKNCGYPFETNEEMKLMTDEIDVQPLLDNIEQHIKNMPDAYGKGFRYIMHRDLHRRVRTYEMVARKRVNRTCDPRFIARHA